LGGVADADEAPKVKGEHKTANATKVFSNRVMMFSYADE
jgi:hypothetical protein